MQTYNYDEIAFSEADAEIFNETNVKVNKNKVANIKGPTLNVIENLNDNLVMFSFIEENETKNRSDFKEFFSRTRDTREYSNKLFHLRWIMRNDQRKKIKYFINCDTIPTNANFLTMIVQQKEDNLYVLKQMNIQSKEATCIVLNFMVRSVLYEWTHTLTEIILYEKAKNARSSNLYISFHGNDYYEPCIFPKSETIAHASATNIHINKNTYFSISWGLNSQCILALNNRTEFECIQPSQHLRDLLKSYGPVQDSGIDLYRVVLHEMGHVFGLDHTNEFSSIMYPNFETGTLKNSDVNILEQSLTNL